MSNEEIRVRDRRGKFFWINNEIIETHAAKIGGTALLVYMVLCKFADNETAECFPSQILLGRICGVSDRTVRTCLATLEKVGLIACEQVRKEGEFGKNIYTLLDVRRKQASDGTVGSPPSEATVGSQEPTNNTHLELDSVKELDSDASREIETLEPTPEPTTTPNPSSDRNDAMAQRTERLRMADQRQAEKQAGKGRGLRSPAYDRKQQAAPRETFAEIRERKNQDAVSNPQLRDCLRDALLEAAAVLGKELDALQVRVWVTDMRPYQDELIAEAFTAYRRKSGKYFPRPGDIIEIIEQLNKPTKETALEKQQRENRERRARNAEEARA